MELTNNLQPYSLQEVKECIKQVNSKVENVFLHWTAGRYNQVYFDYHISIDEFGRVYLPSEDLLQYRVHTYMRNSNSVAIAINGCFDACANNGYNCTFGSEGPTSAQIETMALLVAMFVKYGGVPFEHIKTHCEQAFIDGYGPYSNDPETRWDLWFLRDYDGQMKPGGEVIRGKAVWYLQNSNV